MSGDRWAWGAALVLGVACAGRRGEGDPGESARPRQGLGTEAADWSAAPAGSRPWTGLPGEGPEPAGTGDTGAVPVPGAPLEVCINEFMASNRVAFRDPSGSASDWIELHNPTGLELPLDGWSLTDDPSEPRKHVLSGGLALPAGGFLLLWADGLPALGPDHLGFALAEGGEAVGLFAPDGTGSVIHYGRMSSDLAVGRVTDCCVDPAGSCLRVGFAGTPGRSNAW